MGGAANGDGAMGNGKKAVGNGKAYRWVRGLVAALLRASMTVSGV